MRISPFVVAAMSGYLLATGPARAGTALEDPSAVLHLRYVTVMVKNYDEALAWYTKVWVSKARRSQLRSGASLAGGGT